MPTDVTIVEDLNSPAFPGAAVHERIEHKISLLEHADQVDPHEMQQLVQELMLYTSSLAGSPLPMSVQKAESKRLEAQFARLKSLQEEA